MKPQRKSTFERDFGVARDKFPKLSYDLDKKRKLWVITGELDICDQAGIYWGTFDIRIFVPQNYPHCVPVVQELSTVIPRDIDWHIDADGFCCLDIQHRMTYDARKGINLSDFIMQKVYSFFANQLYKINHGSYAGEEYQHHFPGVAQFYREDLGLGVEAAILMLEGILEGWLGRNERCPCGGLYKLKNCHFASFSFLKWMGRDQLKKDLKSFRALADQSEARR
jgi:hypothetical protein